MKNRALVSVVFTACLGLWFNLFGLTGPVQTVMQSLLWLLVGISGFLPLVLEDKDETNQHLLAKLSKESFRLLISASQQFRRFEHVHQRLAEKETHEGSIQLQLDKAMFNATWAETIERHVTRDENLAVLGIKQELEKQIYDESNPFIRGLCHSPFKATPVDLSLYKSDNIIIEKSSIHY